MLVKIGVQKMDLLNARFRHPDLYLWFNGDLWVADKVLIQYQNWYIEGYVSRFAGVVTDHNAHKMVL